MNPALRDAAAPSILIVDDDPLVLHALETTMLGAKYPCFATVDPLVGLKYLREHRVSVIIADQRMDAMSGLELLGHARHLQPHAARILITGLLSVQTLTDAVNGGEIFRFIAKPWSTPELINTIHNAVQRYHLLCENAALQAETQRLNADLLAEKLSLKAQVTQLAADKTELERVIASLGANRGGIFKFCEAALNAFDHGLATRTRRTVEICHLLAEAAGLPADLREHLIASAWFHDLGLIAVARNPEHPIHHDAAGAELRDHPAVSERLALAAGLGETVAAAVRAHHESFDGGGFPDRRRGRQIPETARWLTPVAFLVSCGLSRQRALEELERLTGIAFDPHCVPFLLRIVLSMPAPTSQRVPTAPAGGAQNLRRVAMNASIRELTM